MIKKIIFASLFAAAFASAQLVEDPNAYTSGAQESDLPVMNVNHTENDEPTFAVSIHPISMLILSLFDIPSIYMTIEGNLGSHLSLITRPHLIWKDFSDDDEELDIVLFGISEGLRYYFISGHEGWFAAAHFNYDRASMDYKYDRNPDDNFDVSLNGFGFGIYVGHKMRVGLFTSSCDIGYTYTHYSASSKEEDDVEKITSVGSGLDLNYTIGIAF